MVEIAKRGSFFAELEWETTPFYWPSHHKYIEPITTRPIEDFLEGRPREGTRYL